MAYASWSVIAGETPTATKWNILGTNDADFDDRLDDVELSVFPIEANSDGATITFDLANSNYHTVTLGGNRTLAVSNAQVGQRFVIRLLQDGTGSRTVNWFSSIKWPYGVAPTLTTTANKADVFGFVCTSAGQYDGFTLGQSL